MKLSDNERFFLVFDKLKEEGAIGTLVELATVLNTNKAGVNDLKSGKKKLSIDNLRSLKKAYPDVNVDFLLNEDGDPVLNRQGESADEQRRSEFILRTDRRVENQMIPLFDMSAAAGLVSVFNGTPNIIDYISIPNLPKCDGALKATGDSMYPLVKAGDIIAYKRVTDIPDGILWGEMYVLSLFLNDEDLILIKYLQKSELGDDYVKLVSQNQHHGPKDVKLKSITALGQIKATIRYNSMN